MLPIELGYGLMIAGALLVVAGIVGLALRRNKEDEAEPVALPGDAPWKGLRSDSPPGSNPRLREQRHSPTEDDRQQ
jgi:hypothetical protein